MPSLSPADHDKMMSSWQRWRALLAETMDAIHDALENRDYATASSLMDDVTQQQAQVSVRMSNVLIRNGFIKGDSSDDE